MPPCQDPDEKRNSNEGATVTETSAEVTADAEEKERHSPCLSSTPTFVAPVPAPAPYSPVYLGDGVVIREEPREINGPAMLRLRGGGVSEKARSFRRRMEEAKWAHYGTLRKEREISVRGKGSLTDLPASLVARLSKESRSLLIMIQAQDVFSVWTVASLLKGMAKCVTVKSHPFQRWRTLS
jgi:hypothetical protein